MNEITKDKYLSLTRDSEFEKVVSQATEELLVKLDSLVTGEVKMRYITHIFAKTLDEAADWIKESNHLN